MTISELLKKYSTHELGNEIEILLGHVLGQSKEFLYMNGDYVLTATEAKRIEELAEERIEKETPIAYLTGYKNFYGLNFKVNKNVLIPRPETEWIVDESLRILAKKQKVSGRKTLRVLDVGTGSGAIAVSIAFNSDASKVQVFASDISDKALSVAKRNALAAKANITFYKAGLLSGLKGKFDIIIANLPYVPESDYKKLYENLKHEPKLALSDGTDDFVLIKKLINQLRTHLNKDAIVLLEIDPKASDMKANGFKKTVIKDFKGLDRFIKLSLTKRTK